MADEYTYDGGALTIVRVGSVELTQVAEMGQEGTGTMVLDDTAGTQEIIGHKDMTATEADCVNANTWSGFVDDREWDRLASIRRAPRTGASRAITVNVVDLNNLLSQTGVVGSDCKRPAETCQERFDWLTGSNDWPPQVFVGTRIDIPDKGMTKADYRYTKPGDVLSDIATSAGGLNYHVDDWSDGDGPELTFRNDNTSTADSSDVRISNVLADVDSYIDTLGPTKTFEPSMDFKLNRSPRDVISKASGSYGKGSVTDSRAATATAFNGERYGTWTNSNIKTSAKAADWMADFLWIHSTERDFLTGSILVPSSAVNLVRQGERLQVKFSHMANTGGRDYDDWTWCRVVERTVVPLLVNDAVSYELRLRLSPQEEAAPTGAIVQSAFEHISAGEPVELPNPVTIGNRLVCVIGQRNFANPASPHYLDTTLPRWGPGAWTKLPNVTAGQRDDGVAIWTKIADSTESIGWIGATNAVIGIFELSGVTTTGAATASKDEQAASTTMDIGSLGTPASGSVCIQVGMYFDQKNLPDSGYPVYTPGAGWTGANIEGRGSLHPSYFGGIIEWNAPLIWIAYQVSDGSAVSATGSRSALHHLDGRWGGAAIALPPV